MKYRIGLPALLLGAAVLAFAQDQPQPPAPIVPPAAQTAEKPAPTRVATLFAQNAISSTQEGQKAATTLSAQFEPQRQAFEKKKTEVQNLKDQLRRTQATIPADARDKLNRSIDDGTRELQRLTEDYQTQVEEKEGAVMQELGDKLLKVIDQYAREHDFAVVLDVSARSGPIVWAYPAVDITNDIVRLYDKTYPLQPAAPAVPPPTKK